MNGRILYEYSRSQLKQDADSPGSYSNGYFDSYVLAFLELNKDRLCIAEKVTMEQALDVIKKYLNVHPEEVHLLASDPALKAIQTAWP